MQYNINIYILSKNINAPLYTSCFFAIWHNKSNHYSIRIKYGSLEQNQGLWRKYLTLFHDQNPHCHLIRDVRQASYITAGSCESLKRLTVFTWSEAGSSSSWQTRRLCLSQHAKIWLLWVVTEDFNGFIFEKHKMKCWLNITWPWWEFTQPSWLSLQNSSYVIRNVCDREEKKPG